MFEISGVKWRCCVIKIFQKAIIIAFFKKYICKGANGIAFSIVILCLIGVGTLASHCHCWRDWKKTASNTEQGKHSFKMYVYKSNSYNFLVWDWARCSLWELTARLCLFNFTSLSLSQTTGLLESSLRFSYLCEKHSFPYMYPQTTQFFFSKKKKHITRG